MVSIEEYYGDLDDNDIADCPTKMHQPFENISGIDSPVTRRECVLLRKTLKYRIASAEETSTRLESRLQALDIKIDSGFKKLDSADLRDLIIYAAILVAVVSGRAIDLGMIPL